MSETILKESEPVLDNGEPAVVAKPRPRKLLKRLGKPVLSAILVMLVLFVGGVTYQSLKKLKKDPPERAPVVKVYNVEVFPIRSADIPEFFPAYGTAEANRDVAIAAKVSGEIQVSDETHRLLKAGQVVEPNGRLLFLIDPSTYRQKVKQAKLQVALDEKELAVLRKEKANNRKLLDKAKLDLAEYRGEYERIEKAKNQGAAVESELSMAKLELQRYETLLTRAQNTQDLYPVKEQQILARKERHLAEQRLAEIDLEHTRVSAPFRGKLSEVNVEPGEYVRVGDPLVKLTDAGVVEIPMALSLENYGKIERMVRNANTDEERPLVSLAVSENSPFRWQGRVVRVSPQADEVTRTVKVYVRVVNDNPSSRGEAGPTVVVPRMHYFGLIEGPVLRQVIAVPRDAITNGRVYVAGDLTESTVKDSATGKSIKIYEGTADEREIKVRRTFRDLAIVELGLADGEYVVLTNLDVIHNGAKVRFREDQVRSLRDELRDSQLQGNGEQ